MMSEETARIAELEAALSRCIQENIALRVIAGGGCDANKDGPHETVIQECGYAFCAGCGETVRNGKSKPWINAERIERAIDRLSGEV